MTERRRYGRAAGRQGGGVAVVVGVGFIRSRPVIACCNAYLKYYFLGFVGDCGDAAYGYLLGLAELDGSHSTLL